MVETERTLTLTGVYDSGKDTDADRWFATFDVDCEDDMVTFGLAMGEHRGPQGVCYTVETWADEWLAGEIEVWTGHLDASAELSSLPVPEGVRKALKNEFALFKSTEGYTR